MLNGNSSKERATNGGERARMGPRKTEKERHKMVVGSSASKSPVAQGFMLLIYYPPKKSPRIRALLKLV